MSLAQENTILDLPTAVVSVYLDQNEPRTPGKYKHTHKSLLPFFKCYFFDVKLFTISFFLSKAIVVASGPFVFVYKNMRPYFKFTLPALDVSPLEEEAWTHTREVPFLFH